MITMNIGDNNTTAMFRFMKLVYADLKSGNGITLAGINYQAHAIDCGVSRVPSLNVLAKSFSWNKEPTMKDAENLEKARKAELANMEVKDCRDEEIALLKSRISMLEVSEGEIVKLKQKLTIAEGINKQQEYRLRQMEKNRTGYSEEQMAEVRSELESERKKSADYLEKVRQYEVLLRAIISECSSFGEKLMGLTDGVELMDKHT